MTCGQEIRWSLANFTLLNRHSLSVSVFLRQRKPRLTRKLPRGSRFSESDFGGHWNGQIQVLGQGPMGYLGKSGEEGCDDGCPIRCKGQEGSEPLRKCRSALRFLQRRKPTKDFFSFCAVRNRCRQLRADLRKDFIGPYENSIHRLVGAANVYARIWTV